MHYHQRSDELDLGVKRWTLTESQELDDQLALMAADPQIQSELQETESEFALAESDGLEIA
jgi:hypothetical protein